MTPGYDARCRLGKWLGFLAGMLLGNTLVLVPALIQLVNNPVMWTGYARYVGPTNSILYHLLPNIPVGFLVGLFFGIIGQAWGGRWQETANQRSAQRIAAVMQAQQAGNVWPPPPITGDTDEA